jgi:hypothetical protein
LNDGEVVTRVRIVGNRPQDLFEDRESVVRLLLVHQTCAVFFQRGRLRRKHWTAFLKMLHGGWAIVFFVSERGEHCVSGWFVGPNFQYALQKWSGSTAAGFVLQFGGAFQRCEVIGRDREGLIVCRERFAIAAELR